MDGRSEGTDASEPEGLENELKWFSEAGWVVVDGLSQSELEEKYGCILCR